MPAPQLNGKSQTRERPTYNEMLWEQLQDTKVEVRETRKELNARMDRIERRMDKLEEEMKATRQELNARMDKQEIKIDELRKELSNKIDALHNEIKSSTGHISIANISTVGIALAVIYSIIK